MTTFWLRFSRPLRRQTRGISYCRPLEDAVDLIPELFDEVMKRNSATLSLFLKRIGQPAADDVIEIVRTGGCQASIVFGHEIPQGDAKLRDKGHSDPPFDLFS